jgi:hypothetical protein
VTRGRAYLARLEHLDNDASSVCVPTSTGIVPYKKGGRKERRSARLLQVKLRNECRKINELFERNSRAN